MTMFETSEKSCQALLELEVPLVLPAYDYCIKASHYFNLLDARGAISVTERQRYIGRVRRLARLCAKAYLEQRERLGFPLLKTSAADAAAPQS